MKIVVPVQGVIFFRNFVTSGALNALAAEHEVVVCAATPEVTSFPLPGNLSWGPTVRADPRRAKIRYYVQEFVMCGLRGRSRTFRLKLYRLRWRKRWLYRMIANPWTARLVQRWSERYLGVSPELYAQLAEMRPDVVLIPSSCEDSLTADLVGAARKLGSKSLVVVNGWDNLTSKGTIPVPPDRLGVWGPQASEDAQRVHGVAKDGIVVLGAPHFERYFRKDSAVEKDGVDVRALNGIPQGTPVILFGGCLQPFDEISVLRQLDQAIRAGRLAAHVLYRPHPWRHPRQHEDPFDPAEYRHVTLDQQVADVFMKVKGTGDTALAKQRFPELDYYPRIIQMAEFIMSPLSTFVLESLLMGKKTLAICYSDGKHFFSADKVSQYDHVQYLTDAPGLAFCREPGALESLCRELLSPADQADLSRRIREHLRYVVYSDQQPYAERLARAVATLGTR